MADGSLWPFKGNRRAPVRFPSVRYVSKGPCYTPEGEGTKGKWVQGNVYMVKGTKEGKVAKRKRDGRKEKGEHEDGIKEKGKRKNRKGKMRCSRFRKGRKRIRIRKES